MLYMGLRAGVPLRGVVIYLSPFTRHVVIRNKNLKTPCELYA